MSDSPMQEFWVGRDVDRLGEHLGLGISNVFFKVSTGDSHGSLVVVEMTHHAKGVRVVTFTTNRMSGSMSLKVSTSLKWARS